MYSDIRIQGQSTARARLREIVTHKHAPASMDYQLKFSSQIYDGKMLDRSGSGNMVAPQMSPRKLDVEPDSPGTAGFKKSLAARSLTVNVVSAAAGFKRSVRKAAVAPRVNHLKDQEQFNAVMQAASDHSHKMHNSPGTDNRALSLSLKST